MPRACPGRDRGSSEGCRESLNVPVKLVNLTGVLLTLPLAPFDLGTTPGAAPEAGPGDGMGSTLVVPGLDAHHDSGRLK